MSGNSSIRANALQVKLVADGSDQVVAWSNTSNLMVLTSVANLYANSTINAQQVIIQIGNTPVNSVAPTPQGTLWSDGNYIYYAVSNNQIKRIALSSF